MVISNVPLLEDGSPGKNNRTFLKSSLFKLLTVYPLKELLERNKHHATSRI